MKNVTRLLRWYAKNGRTLPWRHTTDPYKILVSEVMLQQTQVRRVLLFYKKWLKQFPDWKTLAAAKDADVIHAWAGLGYNRRALMLKRIAEKVVQDGVPQSKEQWLQLKGIGPYTAAALTVFSLRKKAFPIDTNIRRTLGRLYLGKPYPQAEDDVAIEEQTKSELLSSKKFYDVPQALFDLANLHCTKVPGCTTCPMRDTCKASQVFLTGKAGPPKRLTKKTKERIHDGKKYPDRIYRGRILKAVREQGKVDVSTLGPRIDASFDEKKDAAWVRAMAKRLSDDGLVSLKKDTLTLPEG